MRKATKASHFRPCVPSGVLHMREMLTVACAVAHGSEILPCFICKSHASTPEHTLLQCPVCLLVSHISCCGQLSRSRQLGMFRVGDRSKLMVPQTLSDAVLCAACQHALCVCDCAGCALCIHNAYHVCSNSTRAAKRFHKFNQSGGQDNVACQL